MTHDKVDKVKLLEIISKVYERSEGKDIVLYAVGGTALTLLDKKEASKDIDFIVNRDDWDLVGEILDGLSKEYSVRIDRFFNGWMVGYWLPDDFREKALNLARINNLRIESPYLIDLLITKLIANRNEDRRDIESILETLLESAKNETLARLVDYTFNKPSEGLEKKEAIKNFILSYFTKKK